MQTTSDNHSFSFSSEDWKLQYEVKPSCVRQATEAQPAAEVSHGQGFLRLLEKDRKKSHQEKILKVFTQGQTPRLHRDQILSRICGELPGSMEIACGRCGGTRSVGMRHMCLGLGRAADAVCLHIAHIASGFV